MQSGGFMAWCLVTSTAPMTLTQELLNSFIYVLISNSVIDCSFVGSVCLFGSMDSSHPVYSTEWLNNVIAVITLILSFSISEIQETLHYCSAILQRRSPNPLVAPSFGISSAPSTSGCAGPAVTSSYGAEHSCSTSSGMIGPPLWDESGGKAPEWCECGHKCSACNQRWCSRRSVHTFNSKCHCYICHNAAKRGWRKKCDARRGFARHCMLKMLHLALRSGQVMLHRDLWSLVCVWF